MRTRQYTLTSKDVQEYAFGLLQHYLRLQDYSKKCTVAVLFHVLFAAARLTSIFAVCKRLLNAPSDQTIRDALAATLPDYAELQRRVNRALAGDLPKALRRRRQVLGIDLNLQPYYGKPYQDANEIYRSQAKQGTNNFHAYATMYVVRKGLRYTVALTPVYRGEAMADVVKRLRQQAAKAGVRPRLLLLDRGFYSVDVIRYLQAAHTPFLMPAVAHGRQPAAGQTATGIRAFTLWKKGGWGQHTLVNGQKRKATVRIAVYCGNYRGQRKRRGRYAWVYAYWGFRPGSLRWVADTYRLRFGIETSYRQMNQARIRTCTRNPVVRFLLVAIALILRNVWVFLHWEVLSSPHRGGRVLRLEKLRFQTLLHWLLRVAESFFGVVEESTTQRPPPKRFMNA